MKTITPIEISFGKRLTEFMRLFRIYVKENSLLQNPNHLPPPVNYEIGIKYAKILVGFYGKQVTHCLIDFSGNIYGPDYPRNPKQESVGSIYDENCSIGSSVTFDGVRKKSKITES